MALSDVFMRATVAVLIGGLIGYEREVRQRPAGLRTNILVCLGAAVIAMVQLQLVETAIAITAVNPELLAVVKVDLARFGAQVVSGIGFLGAGTIMVQKGTVKGLTTASTIWVVACIGLAAGYGFYEIALVAAAFTAIANIVIKRLETRITHK